MGTAACRAPPSTSTHNAIHGCATGRRCRLCPTSSSVPGKNPAHESKPPSHNCSFQAFTSAAAGARREPLHSPAARAAALSAATTANGSGSLEVRALAPTTTNRARTMSSPCKSTDLTAAHTSTTEGGRAMQPERRCECVVFG